MLEADKTELYLISQGNEIAFDNFMERYSARIYYHIFGILGDHELTEETVSDIFLEVWQRRKRLPEIENILSWLNTIAFHRAVSVYRKERRRKKIPIDTVPDFHFPEIQTPLDGIISEEERQRLNRAIDALPPKCKHVFFLAKVEELSYEEIAKLLQISRSTVNYHITFAISKLREQLKGNVNSTGINYQKIKNE